MAEMMGVLEEVDAGNHCLPNWSSRAAGSTDVPERTFMPRDCKGEENCVELHRRVAEAVVRI